MSIPYYVLGIIYLVIFTGYMLVLTFNLYHMIRWGLFNFTGRLNTSLVLSALVIIFVVTMVLLSQVDWFGTFSPFDVTVNNFDFSL